MEIVKLIGSDVLPDDQKLIIEIATCYPRRLPAAERLPRRGHLCAAGKAAEDDGDHPVPVRQVCSAGRQAGAGQPSMLATGMFDELVKMKYEVPNDDSRMLDDHAERHRCQTGRRGPGLMRRE